MNYIAEIKAFYGRLAAVPLSADAQALWHLMMHLANCADWPPALCLAEAVLTGTLGISHGAFVAARRELVKAGLILHVPQPGRQAPHYFLRSIMKPGKLQVIVDNTGKTK